MGSPSLASAALFLVGWSCGWLLLWRPRPLPPRASDPTPRPPLTVVVPARDEESSLPLLLATLVPQLRPGDRCVVVDDESSDRTAAVAAAGGAEVVAAPPRPEGWTGKAWACATGAALAGATSGGEDVLVFLDADVRLERPDVLDRLAAEVTAAPDGLVSVQPWHRTGRPVEQLSLFFNVTALMGSVAFTVLGTRVRPTLAFGPVLACRQAAYEASGGHAHALGPGRGGRGHRARPALPLRRALHRPARRLVPHVPGRPPRPGPGLDEEHRLGRGQRALVVRAS